MTQALDNAKNLYLRGIRDGAIEEVQVRYMGATYTQHSTGVPDNKEGFAQFFQDFSSGTPSGTSPSSEPWKTPTLSFSMSTKT